MGRIGATSLYPITIIMPIRNEADHIARSLGAVLSQEYPLEKMEVLVIDGMSDDGTREIVQDIIAHTNRDGNDAPKVQLLDNQLRIVPSALNIGLDHACGDVIIRVDGHCEIAPNYVSQCIKILEETGAECVGGSIRTIGTTPVGQVISMATSSIFGVGGAAFRLPNPHGKYVDTLAFGAYRRQVFEEIGGFDQELVRNQDDEFNFRLIQAGGKIWLDPSINSTYYSRASLRSLWRQYFEYGLYKVLVMTKRRGVASWRHLVPGLFVTGALFSFILALATFQPL